jgi:hypothetical protein
LEVLCEREDLLSRRLQALERLAALNEARADRLGREDQVRYATMAANYRLLVSKLLENHMADFNMVYQNLQISTLDFPAAPESLDRPAL